MFERGSVTVRLKAARKTRGSCHTEAAPALGTAVPAWRPATHSHPLTERKRERSNTVFTRQTSYQLTILVSVFLFHPEPVFLSGVTAVPSTGAASPPVWLPLTFPASCNTTSVFFLTHKIFLKTPHPSFPPTPQAGAPHGPGSGSVCHCAAIPDRRTH